MSKYKTSLQPAEVVHLRSRTSYWGFRPYTPRALPMHPRGTFVILVPTPH